MAKLDNQFELFRGFGTAVEGQPPMVDERPDVLQSRTYKLRVPINGDMVDLYLTVSDRDGRPFEFFLNCSDGQLTEYLSAVSLLGSRMLRNGFPVEMVVEDLESIQSPFTGHMRRGGYCPSLSALIARTLLAHANRSEAI